MRLRLATLRGVSPVLAILAAVTAAWTAFAVAHSTGWSPPVGGPRAGSLLLVLVPAALVSAALLRRGEHVDRLPAMALWTALVAGALIATPYLLANPVVALGIPACAISAVLCARYPAAAVTGVVALVGFGGTLRAFTAVRPAPLIDLVLIGLLAAALTRRARSTGGRHALVPGAVAVAVYLLITTFEILTAETTFLGVQAFRNSPWFMVGALAIGIAPWDRATFDRVLRGVLVVALAVAAYAVYRWRAGLAPEEIALAGSSIGQYSVVGGDIATIGSFPTRGDLALWCSVMVPFCAVLALSWHGRWRAAAATAAALGLLALLATEVRSASVAVGVAVAVVMALYLLSNGFTGARIGVAAVATVLGLCAGAVIFEATAGRSEQSTDRYAALLRPSTDPSYIARTYKWRAAVQDIDRRPFGQGLGASGNTQRVYGRYVNLSSYSIDNSYLKIALEQGAAVTLLFVVGLLLLLYDLVKRALLTIEREAATMLIAASAALVAMMILFFVGAANEGSTVLAGWILVGLGIGQAARLRVRPASSAA